MKTLIKTIAIPITIILLTINVSLAQDPPPPPGHGTSGNVPGGGAPIGSGLLVLIALGAAYGGKKVFDYRKIKKT